MVLDLAEVIGYDTENTTKKKLDKFHKIKNFCTYKSTINKV